MPYLRRIILFVLLAMPLGVAAQWDDVLEQWVEEHGTGGGVAEMSDLLQQLSDNPVNLNDSAATATLPFLSPFQRMALNIYILLYGQLLSVQELRMVPGFDSVTRALIAPLVTVAPYTPHAVPSLGEIVSRGRHTLTMGLGGTVEQAEGYRSGKYEGDNLHGQLCYHFNYDNRVILQFSADKDPTEMWGRDNFYGYSLTLKHLGRLEQLVVGRYNLQFGQGVALWTGFEPFAIAGHSPVRYAGGIKAASPFNEEGWQQGAAATLRVARSMRLSTFASRNDDEWLGGAHLEYRRGNLIVGLTALGIRYDDSVVLKNYVYNQDYFRGDRSATLGADFLWQRGRLLLFGEAAVDGAGHPAIVGGTRLVLPGDNSVGLSLRHYNPCYHSLHSAAYGIGSSTRNEQGISIDGQFHLPFRLTAMASADWHHFPHIKYGCYAPSTGLKLQGQVSRQFGARCEATLRYTLRQQDRNVPGTSGALIETTHRQVLQAMLRYTCGSWRYTSRLMLSRFDDEHSEVQRGWLVAQEVRYTQGRWQATMQVAWHDVDSYYARLYLSESYLQYAFSMPSLQGRGLRGAAVLRWSLSRHLVLGFKYALTWRPDEEAIGSGAAATEGPLRQTWNLQLRLKM